MRQAREALIVILIFCYNYRVDYFSEGPAWGGLIIRDLAFFLLMSMRMLNDIYCKGKSPSSVPVLFFMLCIDVGMLVLHVLQIYLTSSIQLHVMRIIWTLALAVMCSFGQAKRSKTSWTFAVLNIAHAVLISDLIRMSCLVMGAHLARQLVPLLVFLFLAGISCAFLTDRKGIPIMVRAGFLVSFSCVFLWLISTLIGYRYEMRNDNFLTMKDTILALKVLRKINPVFEGEQFVYSILSAPGINAEYKENARPWLDWITPFVSEKLLPMFSYIYPLDYDSQAIARIPEFAEVGAYGFDEESVFGIPPCSQYARNLRSKDEFRKEALECALQYYNGYLKLCWLLFLLCCGVNLVDSLKRVVQVVRQKGARMFVRKVKDE